MRLNHTRFGPVGIDFDERVLRPRPWTLAQSEWAAELADGTVILELGCGAGQIGLAAAALSGCGVVQVDRDAPACHWAAHNAVANDLAGVVVQRCGSTDAALAGDQQYGVVIADPPYLPSAEIGRFPNDPPGAIDGGADGLGSIRTFVRSAGVYLRPGGRVILQVRGMRQVEDVRDWLAGPASPALTVADYREFDRDRALALLVGAGEAATYEGSG